ncbi:MAG: agmatinase [Desulfovibrionaceae bacterium]
MHSAFLASEFAPSPPAAARFHIIPVPYEASVSYGHGTALGPQAILEASQQLEAFDGLSQPGSHGIYTHPPLDCSGSPESVLARIQQATAAALQCHALPVLLGGEHSLTLGALRALQARYGRFGIVQFDAHADLRPSYEGSIYSHACVMHRAVADLHLPLVQMAVRDFCLEEAQIRLDYNVIHFDGPTLARHGLPTEPLPPDFPEHIYISFDVDGLDSSVMPATGTPVPGGLSWYDALSLVETCTQARTVIGMDIVELAPIPALHFASYTAARLTYHLMGIVERANF